MTDRIIGAAIAAAAIAGCVWAFGLNAILHTVVAPALGLLLVATVVTIVVSLLTHGR